MDSKLATELLDVSHDTRHARIEMIQIVAVEQPPAGIVRVEVDCHLPSMSRNDDRVFDCVTDLEEVAVKVHRMDDWTLVGHPNPNVFAGSDI